MKAHAKKNAIIKNYQKAKAAKIREKRASISFDRLAHKLETVKQPNLFFPAALLKIIRLRHFLSRFRRDVSQSQFDLYLLY